MRKLLSWFLGLFRKKAVDDTVSVDNYPEGDEVDTVMLGKGEGPMRGYPCGHTGYSRFTVFLFGREAEVDSKQSPMCHKCTVAFLQEHTIRCAACGADIAPGSPVALYSDSSKSLGRRDVGRKVGNSWIGCMLWDCCPSGGFYAGHWTARGFMPAFASGLAAAVHAAQTGEMLIGEIEPLKEGT